MTQCLAGACIFSLLPVITKRLLDKAVSEHIVPLDLVIAFALIEVFVITFFRISDWVWIHYQPLLRNDLANIMLERMQQHSLCFFQDQHSGNLSSKLQDAIINITAILETVLFEFLFSFFGVTMALFAVCTTHFWFAILLSTWVITFFGIQFLLMPWATVLSRQLSESGARIMGKSVDIITNLMTVKLFVGYPRERDLIRNEQRILTQHSYAADRFLWLISFLQAITFCVYEIVCLVLLAKWYPKGLVTPGDFALIMGINGSLIPMLWNTSQQIRGLVKKYSALKQAVSVIMQSPSIIDKPEAAPLVVTKGEIVFDNVTFGYETSQGPKTLFDEFSVTIPAGQKIGLVGYSGGGKSTFTNLILRLFDVQKGRILIDGQDVRDVAQDSLRSQISMIPQDPTLFHRSLFENIRYGKPNATDEAIIRAAKKAHIHDYIMTLENGYNTEVGERGLKLSGGQRQRIAIARSFLKDAPIVIMDEATSQLDTLTERMIHNDSFEYMTGKTVIVIAHRLSTLQKMDRILVFEAGRIVQDGAHQGLLEQKGLYKTLWDMQYVELIK